MLMLVFATVIVGLSSCSVCKPDKAAKALKGNLPFKKTELKLVKDDHENCTYVFEVTAKNIKQPVYFQVTREHKKWVHSVVTK
jgi:hypothetical protein